MKFFLIYQYKGVPVDISSFKSDYQQHVRYDSVHILNTVN